MPVSSIVPPRPCRAPSSQQQHGRGREAERRSGVVRLTASSRCAPTVDVRTRHDAHMASTVFEPAALGPLTLRNRIIKAATFEGCTPDGVVSPELIEFHRRVAAGGAAMTTVAYLSIAPEGRTGADALLAATRARQRTALAHRHRARRGRVGCGPDRPRRPGRERVLQRSGGAGAGPHVQPPRHALDQARHRGRHRAGHLEVRNRRPAVRPGWVRLDRGAPRPQLPAQRVPVADCSTSATTGGAAHWRTVPGSPDRSCGRCA